MLGGPLPELPDLFLGLLFMRDGEEGLEFLDDNIEAAPGLVIAIDVQGYESEIFVLLHQTRRPEDLGLEVAITVDD